MYGMTDYDRQTSHTSRICGAHSAINEVIKYVLAMYGTKLHNTATILIKEMDSK